MKKALSVFAVFGFSAAIAAELWLAVGDIDAEAWRDAYGKDAELVRLECPKDGTIADWTPENCFAREPFLARGGVRGKEWREKVAQYAGKNVKGVVWIGPEGDFTARKIGDRGFHYADMLDNLVRGWRENLRSGEIPFVLAQPCSRSDVPDAATIRSQMLAVTKRSQKVKVVNLSDLRPGDRKEIARRLAKAEVYPEYRSCSFGEKVARFEIKGCAKIAGTPGTEGWEIRCGAESPWMKPESVRVQNGTVLIVSAPPGMPRVTGLRYMQKADVADIPALRGENGLPLNGFQREEENSPKGINRNFKIKYPDRVLNAQRRRGVMLPADREVTEEEFDVLERWGANLLRYQMATWSLGKGGSGDFTKYNPWIERCLDRLDKEILPRAKKRGMMVVVDLHVVPGQQRHNEFGEFEHSMFYNELYFERFVELWEEIARRFKGRSEIYGYDLFNEPGQLKAAPFDYWTIQKTAAEAIRKIDPDATIIFESNRGSGLVSYPTLSPLPLDNVIYQIHDYRPFEYTHQGLRGMKKDFHPVYPNKESGWNREWKMKQYEDAKALEFRERHGAMLYIGEFSAIAWAPGAEKWIEDHIDVMEEMQVDWTFHAFREFPAWDVEKEGPDLKNLKTVSGSPRELALRSGLELNRIWKNASVGIRTKENKSRYAQGETITFEMSPEGFKSAPPGKFNIRWKCTGGDGKTEEGEAPFSIQHPAVFQTKAEKAGTVRLEAWIGSLDGRAVWRMREEVREKAGAVLTVSVSD